MIKACLLYVQVPFTYCWSEALVPKPRDWGDNIDVVGFFFLDVAGTTRYAPAPDLEAFLAAGPPPVYIGFGSLVVDNPHVRIVTRIAGTGPILPCT